VDVSRQPPRDAQVGVKQIQLLDHDPSAVDAIELAVAAIEPDPGAGHVQIPDRTARPAVNRGGFLAAVMAHGCKALVGFHLNTSPVGLRGHRLALDLDSTKGEVRCYSGFGHHRPPVDRVFLRRSTYTPGDTGCPLCLKSQPILLT
jgi:hypothetical protein